MLNPKRWQDKTHSQVMEEIYGKIPIYSNEWTNYNPSDPGITILENLSAFQILQQNQMNEVSDGVRRELLKLLGYTAQKGSCARVLIEAQGVREPVMIPADQRFMVGDISFETALAGKLTGSRIIGVYGKDEKGLRDYSFVLDREVPIGAYVFGKQPKEGMELYLVMDRAPEPEENLCLYVRTENRFQRNPFEKETVSPFAQITWSCYTEAGFVEMAVRDDTMAFLRDGEFHAVMPKEAAAVYEEGPMRGYVWKGVLTKAAYDVPPVLSHISGFLFEAWQKETLSIVHTFQKASEVLLYCSLMEEGYVRVFAKEEKGSSYRLYEEDQGFGGNGRYYRRESPGYGMSAFLFDRSAYGYAPGRVKNAVKIVVYNEEMMRRFYLGQVLGYDEQEILLPKNHIVPETFSLMAVREDGEGGFLYDFVKPGRKEENALYYRLDENTGKIQILDAGAYIGAKLYAASLAVTLGEEGNVRPWNTFVPVGYQDSIRFTNPAAGRGGCFRETLEAVRKRYIQELYTPFTAVTASDYEKLVKETPGLCISKVHAWMEEEKNEIQIAVKPGTGDPFPVLSPVYTREIEKRIEERRLLSARVKIRQPVYTDIWVQGKIVVKPQYKNSRQEIEDKIRSVLDHVDGEGGFGELIELEKLFGAIEQLDCVSYIQSLMIRPGSMVYASTEGTDIRPAPNCLCYAGEIKLELSTGRQA